MAADTREHDLRPTAEERSEIVLHRLSFSPLYHANALSSCYVFPESLSVGLFVHERLYVRLCWQDGGGLMLGIKY